MSVADMVGLGPERKETVNDDCSVTIIVTPPPIFGIKPSRPEGLVLTANQYAWYKVWLAGHGLIQDVLTTISAEDREYLMSGTSWDDEEEDDA